MIVEYLRYQIPAGGGEKFEQTYRDAGAILQASAHCLGYELARCTEDPGSYILRILWDSAEGHLAGFRKEPRFVEFFKLVQPYIANMPEMRHYRPTEVMFQR